MRKRDRTYVSWLEMRRRCKAANRPSWANYGARGVTGCERWEISFAAFLEDMGPRPAGRSLDRIVNARGYEPGNCRWATRQEQAFNRRPPKLDTAIVAEIRRRCLRGELQSAVAEDVGVNPSHVSRIVRGEAWPTGVTRPTER